MLDVAHLLGASNFSRESSEHPSAYSIIDLTYATLPPTRQCAPTAFCAAPARPAAAVRTSRASVRAQAGSSDSANVGTAGLAAIALGLPANAIMLWWVVCEGGLEGVEGIGAAGGPVPAAQPGCWLP